MGEQGFRMTDATPNASAPAPRPPPAEEPAAAMERAAQSAQHQLDPANEKPLWEGRASWKSLVPPLALWGVGLGVLTGLVQYFFKNGSATLIVAAIAALVLLAQVARHMWEILSISYRLTNQRLFIHRGIFVRTTDQTELLRVDDVKIRQNLVEQMLGIGVVEVISSDRTDTRLRMQDLDKPSEVAEHIRRHTRSVQKRTLFMEQL